MPLLSEQQLVDCAQDFNNNVFRIRERKKRSIYLSHNLPSHDLSHNLPCHHLLVGRGVAEDCHLKLLNISDIMEVRD